MFLENVGRRSKLDGDIATFIDVGKKSFNGYEHNVLFHNQGGGSFVDAGAVSGSDRIEDGRGLGIADLDNDGDLDLVIQNYDRPSTILMNRGSKGRALQLRLRGVESNRSAIGSRVTIRHGVRTQTSQVVCGAGYLSSQTQLVHFGLGEAARVDELTVRWPSGLVQVFRDIEADRRLFIVEGSSDFRQVQLTTEASTGGGE